MMFSNIENRAKQKRQKLIFWIVLLTVIQLLVIALTVPHKNYELLFLFEIFFAGMVGLSYLNTYIDKRRKVLIPILCKWGLIPKPTEASIFVMAFTALILSLTKLEIWSEMSYVLSLGSSSESSALPIFIYIIAGIFLSIYHAFSKREKKPWEVDLLKYFTVMTLAMVAISTAVYVYHLKQPGYLIFSVWNAIQAYVLIFLKDKNGGYAHITLPTRDASYVEVMLGTLVVISVLYVESLYNTHWSIAFSSVLIVWSMVGNYFQNDKGKVTS